jgi:hypothetical protein
MKEYDFYENAVVRLLDRHRFPRPWFVEERPACFVVRDNNSKAFAHVYFEDNPAAKMLTREEARLIASKVAALQQRTHTLVIAPALRRQMNG